MRHHYVPERDDDINARCMAYVSEHTGITAVKCQDVIESYIDFWKARPALFDQFMSDIDPNHVPEDMEQDDDDDE